MSGQLKPFSTSTFLGHVSYQFLFLFGLIWLCSKLFSFDLNLDAAKVIVIFFAMEIVTCFFEFFLHRYILHAKLFPFLGNFANEHRHHHSLTPKHKYPITHPKQYESQAFPFWALSIFYLVFAPFIILMQIIFPTWPVLVGGFLAVTWSMCFYEIVHNYQHKPLENWLPLFDIPLFGQAIKAYYLDHLNHHANTRINEAITGFFCGIKLFDYIFRTSHRAKSLRIDGTCVNPQDLRPKHKPLPIIVWLDRLAARQEAKYR